MTDAAPKTAINLDLAGLAWGEDEITEARAIQVCLRHLMREARELKLDMTARVLTAAMDAIDMDLDRRKN